MNKSSKLKVGDWVEVRSREEILSTLDDGGCLDGMPFMPEMLAFCGKRFQVYKRAHKTCDTVFPVRGRRVSEAVHLDTRCDGSAHGGCQASCLLFWKDAWLRPVLGPSAGSATSASYPPEARSLAGRCSETSLLLAAQHPDPATGEPIYTCQATRLPYATESLEWWDARQYVEDYVSGNVGLWRLVCGFVYFAYLGLSNAGLKLGRPMRWFYDTFHPLWRGSPFPRRRGTIPAGEPTPAGDLDLREGDLVRIKPFPQILETLNTQNRNRGLYFDAEEVPYCGRTFSVLKRVTRIIQEKSGRMLEMKTPSFILDNVICESRYSECRLFCPRSIYPYWRGIWLERVDTPRTDNRGNESSNATQPDLTPVAKS